MEENLEQITKKTKILTKDKVRWTKEDWKTTGEFLFYGGLMVGGGYIGSLINETLLGVVGGGVLASLIQDRNPSYVGNEREDEMYEDDNW